MKYSERTMTPTPYSNVEYECLLMGNAVSGNSWEATQAVLDQPVDLFSEIPLQKLAQAIKDLHAAGKPCNDLTVISEAYYAKDKAVFDTAVDVISCAQVISVPYCVSILLDKRKARLMQKLAQQIQAKLAEGDTDVDLLINQVREATQDSNMLTDQKNFSLGEIGLEYCENLAHYQERVIKTGLEDLDRITQGFFVGNVVYIGARPGVGKTAFVLEVARRVATAERNRGENVGGVLMVSLEMDREELYQRLLANVSNVPLDRIMKPWTEEDSEILPDYMGALASLPIDVTTEGYTISSLRKRIVEFQKTRPLRLLIVDYLGLMTDEDDKTTKDIYTSVTCNSKALKRLAKEFRIPIVCLIQLNRDSAKANRAPKCYDARDSGAIEQDADIFIGLWNPPEPDRDDMETDEDLRLYNHWHTCFKRNNTCLQVVVDKNRHGKMGTFELCFDKETMRFYQFAD